MCKNILFNTTSWEKSCLGKNISVCLIGHFYPGFNLTITRPAGFGGRSYSIKMSRATAIVSRSKINIGDMISNGCRLSAYVKQGQRMWVFMCMQVPWMHVPVQVWQMNLCHRWVVRTFRRLKSNANIVTVTMLHLYPYLCLEIETLQIHIHNLIIAIYEEIQRHE